MNEENIQNTCCDYDASPPIDEIELGQPIKELNYKEFFPYDGGKTVCLFSHRLSETWDHEGMVLGFWVGRTGV